jgi:hypothetical protein
MIYTPALSLTHPVVLFSQFTATGTVNLMTHLRLVLWLRKHGIILSFPDMIYGMVLYLAQGQFYLNIHGYIYMYMKFCKDEIYDCHYTILDCHSSELSYWVFRLCPSSGILKNSKKLLFFKIVDDGRSPKNPVIMLYTIIRTLYYLLELSTVNMLCEHKLCSWTKTSEQYFIFSVSCLFC